MTKKKLSDLELKLKKLGTLAKSYANEQVDAAKLKKYTKGTPNTGYLATIILSAATTQQAAEADPNRIEIDIPKDMLLKSSKTITVVAGEAGTAFEGKWVVVKENNVAVTPYEAPAAVTGAGEWIDMVVNSVEGDVQDQHICVDLSKFIDIYTAGNGLQVDNKVFSIKLKLGTGDANVSGLAFDATTGALYINIDATNANGLSIDGDGLKLALATTSTAGAMSAADKVKLNKALTSDDIALLSDAEMGSWFGYAADSTMVTTTLPAVSDDSIEDED